MADQLSPETVDARRGLLDALKALEPHLGSIILVGAQAIYLRTGGAAVAIAEFTTDADLAIDSRGLATEPLIEQAMADAGFARDLEHPNPGAWLSREGVPIDLMVPKGIAGSGRRGVDAPPHDRTAMRSTRGLEAVLVDRDVMAIAALEASDQRSFRVQVAGVGALLIAKLRKINERRDSPRRLDDKDAHDIFRLLVHARANELADTLRTLHALTISSAVTTEAVDILEELFAAGPAALGSTMAGRAELGIGSPAQTSLAVSLLASEVLAAYRE